MEVYLNKSEVEDAINLYMNIKGYHVNKGTFITELGEFKKVRLNIESHVYDLNSLIEYIKKLI